MRYSKYSVVIIGSGIAGMYCALKLAQNSNFTNGILLVTKSELGESNSRYAQGGIVGVIKENTNDSTTSHISDTIKAGAGLSEFNTVKFISENSDEVIKDLLNFGVEFDKDENGNFAYTLEAAHSVNRVLHSGGDATGRMIEQALEKKVRENSDIDLFEYTIAVELLVDEECKGVVVYNGLTQEYETICSPAVILATGGLGQLYKYTTNPLGATADGMALAYNCGAELQDMEFVQFHPTALVVNGKKNRFLISEAVRGEGAKLVDINGVRFMQKYDEKAELAPRDIVTRSIYKEMQINNSENVYLDATVIDKHKLSERFPTISKMCLENGIDISKDFIPVAPAAHYSMGGIKTNVNGETSVKGLFAVGETASNGLHGANRLASNSLLECVVCAFEVAKYIKDKNYSVSKHINENIKSKIDKYKEFVEFQNVDIETFKQNLKEIMWSNAGIYRNRKLLSDALDKLNDLESEFSRNDMCESISEYEFKNMLTVAKIIVNCAIQREESRGAHYRLDFPDCNEEGLHSVVVNKTGELNFVK